MQKVFHYDEYRDFLEAYVESKGKGAKLTLAQALGCQPGYITQILQAKAQISLEQADRFADFIAMPAAARRYWLAIVNLGRAGSESLRSFYLQERERLRGEQRLLKNRFSHDVVLSPADQAVYYSSWHYAAIYVSVSLPGCDSEEGLAKHFRLPLSKVNAVVEFLVEIGLFKRVGDKLAIGPTQVFLGSDSPMITKHHTNWRMRAVESLDHYRGHDLHYSSVVTLSHHDAGAVREILIKAVEEIRAVVKASPHEATYSYAVDLFDLAHP